MHDLLNDPFASVYAVACSIPEAGTLHCGALYVEPGNPYAVIRLADNAFIVDVTLPPECVNNGSAITAWDVDLPCTTP